MFQHRAQPLISRTSSGAKRINTTLGENDQFEIG